VLDTPHR